MNSSLQIHFSLSYDKCMQDAVFEILAISHLEITEKVLIRLSSGW